MVTVCVKKIMFIVWFVLVLLCFMSYSFAIRSNSFIFLLINFYYAHFTFSVFSPIFFCFHFCSLFDLISARFAKIKTIINALTIPILKLTDATKYTKKIIYFQIHLLWLCTIIKMYTLLVFTRFIIASKWLYERVIFVCNTSDSK